jgi:F0F1-type ATP synthase membrane subunit c/vacuolar-type H+-ATPase subunit K
LSCFFENVLLSNGLFGQFLVAFVFEEDVFLFGFVGFCGFNGVV